MAWGDEETIKGEFPWEDDYVLRENLDGSKSICKPGFFGGAGQEIGKQTESFLGGHKIIEAGGGKTDVYEPSFFGPDLSTSEGMSRALSDAAGNAPRPSAPPSGASSAFSGGYAGGSGGGYGGGGYVGGYSGYSSGLEKVDAGSFVWWVLVGAASGLIPTIFAASYTWGTPDDTHYLQALKMLAAFGAAACLVACTVAFALRFNKEQLSEAILGGAALGTAVTIGLNSYLNWKYAQDPHGYLDFPLGVWLIVPGCVVASVPYAAVKRKYLAAAGTRITALTFVRWAAVAACSAVVPLVFAASYTWVQGRHIHYGDALTVLASVGATAAIAACAVGIAAGLSRDALGRAMRRGLLVGTLVAVGVCSVLNWQYAQAHQWSTNRLLFKVWLTAPAFVEKYGRSSAVGHLTFPMWVWFIAPACVVAAAVIVVSRGRSPRRV